MFNPWMAFSLQAVRLGWEAQNVMASRWLRLVGSGATAGSEVERMVAEKLQMLAPAPTPPATPAIKEASGPSPLPRPQLPRPQLPRLLPQAAAPKAAASKATAPKSLLQAAAPKAAPQAAAPKVAASAVKVHKKRLGAKKRRSK